MVVVTVVDPGFAGPLHALGAVDRSPGFRSKDGLVQAGENNHQVTRLRHFPAFREFQKPALHSEMGVVYQRLTHLTPLPFENSRNSDYA